jgi:diguanylate cyclase (GGDEF)-like protein
MKESLIPFLEKAKAEYSAYRRPFSILLIDVDKFKSFNDKHGHVFGDEILQYFSSSLRLSLEEEECVIIRFGGDEFVIVFPTRTSKEVYKIAVNLEANIKNRPFLYRDREYKISFSGGIASCPHDGLESQEIIEKADKAMYVSKRRGGGHVTQYSARYSEIFRRLVRISFAGIIMALVLLIASYIYKLDMSAILNKIKSMRNIAPAIVRDARQANYAIVRLKSGNALEGTIIDETVTDISLKFDMHPGEGTAVIKKSEIAYIDRK